MQYMVNIFFSLQIGRQGYQKAVKLHWFQKGAIYLSNWLL
jgi:hypothetical protein